MGLFEFLRTRTEEEKAVEPEVSDVLLKALLEGETITRKEALTLPVVAGAVDLISNSVACMPVKLYKVKDGKVTPVEDDNRLRLLNGDTGDTLDAFQMKKAMVEDYLLGQGGYCYIKKYYNDIVSRHYVSDEYPQHSIACRSFRYIREDRESSHVSTPHQEARRAKRLQYPQLRFVLAWQA